ncbi:Sec23/Sec24 trunk domain-containing protein [Toxoplasma gondii RUB]|uniref:Protein transport protein SEC23 n=7 Tax=Toxoplasma gondii TaxID=5811 RepID=S7VXH0_TOXGG|nr:Sec23/Sec24 trunk domain-containing protein [Toxoplasma gondii GT1]KAF4644574.1 Sec23/Sec24 trunk domain-containing protein [Toxoplasma gondii]KFG62870.1 Sec23/Sec24 trunk domain-containing protein [Toxoplasma gondii RUB]KFH12673.1 Sec23/Sec24 trunk domain-containing protein [Toxoplasma gondii VAND]
MDVHEHEAATGCRFSWNVWPATRAEAQKIELPLGCMFTPLRDCTSLQLVEYEPVRCRVSGCILNPFCAIDFRSKQWTCPFSLQRNAFPNHYAMHISEQNLPAELLYPTIEYILPQPMPAANAPGVSAGESLPPPLFFLVVDTCVIEEELDQLRDSLMQALALMPSDAMVGIITYGAMAMLHELGGGSENVDVMKAHVFRGNKELTSTQIQQQLGLARSANAYVPAGGPGAPAGSPLLRPAAARFIQPVGECEYKLTSILEELRRDSWPVPSDSRPMRCTGLALSVALAVLEAAWYQLPARVLLFVGGACTSGPGQVVDLSLCESIRHHLDLQKDNNNARFVKKALKYYTQLANQAVRSGHAVDIFACSLDQVGLYEMKVMTEKTGGCVVMGDSFSINVFKDSLRKFFETDSTGFLKMGFNAKIEVLCSKEFKVCGAIGPCTGTGKKGCQVSDTIVGEGMTTEWQAAALDKESTVAFYFEVTNQQAQNLPPGKQSFLQFQTSYLHPSGRRRLRVTTLSYRFAEPNTIDVAPGFDQEAAAVLMTRLAVFKTESEESLDVLRWLDRKLIRLVARFADYQKDDPSSFHLSTEFSIYPQFMYHLRRSHFLQTFNASPDETAYYRSVLLRASVMNALVMIQPALLEYSFEQQGPPQPVLLDAQALKPNVILLLDSFFHVVVWHGELIHQWREQGFHNMPEYENLRQLLQAPLEDAKVILDERFPVPKYVQCNSGGSQARFLLAKVNPSTNYAQTAGGGAGMAGLMGDSGAAGESFINTDDVSLKVFMDHLIKLAVQS